MDPLWLLYTLGVRVPAWTAAAGIVFSLISSLILSLTFFFVAIGAFVKFRLTCSKRPKDDDDVKTIGFFHPYCDAGGGGERVLWCAIKALRRRFPSSAKFVVYTGDLQSAPDQILKRAASRFQIELTEKDVEFVYLHKRRWVEAKTFPRFTLIGQSLGSLILGYEALSKFWPDIYIDTMGYAFTLPLFKLFGGCKTACYVHYPTISTDMLDQVRSRTKAHNNRSFISNSWVLSYAKLQYYRIFAALYGRAGRYSDLTMVNSSWTEGHINHLWAGVRNDAKDHGSDDDVTGTRGGAASQHVVVHKVYPPCDTSEFAQIPRRADQLDHLKIVSLGQFRPEKDHALQIRAMFELRQIVEEPVWEKMRLVLIGGCRNAEDEQRVKDLKDLCRHLSVDQNVEFKVNVSFDELKAEMSEATIGLHSMWNEHFGIAVVEMLAAGLVTIAHRSGGPLMDIVVEDPAASRNGYLAIQEREYAAAIAHVATVMSKEARDRVAERARDSVKRFSDQEFERAWIRTTEPLIGNSF